MQRKKVKNVNGKTEDSINASYLYLEILYLWYPIHRLGLQGLFVHAPSRGEVSAQFPLSLEDVGVAFMGSFNCRGFWEKILYP